MARAQSFLADPSPENLNYAALELRFCIEALTYEKLRSFSKMIPEEVLTTWQPPQAVKALLEFEPLADETFELHIGREDDYGKPAASMRFVGTHASLKLAWLRKHYNKLGNLLHAPAVGEVRSQSVEALTKYLSEVVADLQEPIESTITGGSIRNVYSFTCAACSKPVICNSETARKKSAATCFNPQCKAEYFVEVIDEDTASFRLKVTSLNCASDGCPGVADIENRKLEIGYEFSCPICGVKHVIVERHWGYGPKAS
jgi:predicted RNA-binding Zn-ribbon protein involved in translation (DUF1610 family)